MIKPWVNFGYNPDEPSGNLWTVSTSDGDYDAAGKDPLQAVTRLATQLREKLAEVGQ